MKKFLVLLCALVLSLSVTACGSKKESSGTNTKTCTLNDTSDEGYKTTSEYVITYNDSDKVTSVKETSTEEMDPEYVDLYISFSSLFASAYNEIDGIEFNTEKESDNKIKTVISVDYAKLDLDKYKSLLESDEDDDVEDDEDFLLDTDIKVDDFIEKYLDGYTCK